MAKKEDDLSSDKIAELTVNSINKKFGKGILHWGEVSFKEIKRIPTGSLGLDEALGGGWARGRIIEIFGPESSGKTTLALHAIAQFQKEGAICAFIDAEHALDPKYCTSLGVSVKDMMLVQPDCAEQALEITDMLTRSGIIKVIVIDSVAALVPQAELEGDMGQSHMGLQARLMGQALRKLTAISANSDTTIIFLNQIRHKIGIMFGSPETTTGGNALKFYASQRVDIRRIGSVKKDEQIEGNQTRAKVVKNKTARPFQQAEFEIEFGKGINYDKELLQLAIKKEIIAKSGAWYSFGQTRLGQGENNVIELLRSNPELKKEIEEKTIGKASTNKPADSTTSPSRTED